MRPFYHPQSEDISLVGVLSALGDPVRLQIVQRLAETGELTCSYLDCAVANRTNNYQIGFYTRNRASIEGVYMDWVVLARLCNSDGSSKK